jgi:hypothetical protein
MKKIFNLLALSLVAVILQTAALAESNPVKPRPDWLIRVQQNCAPKGALPPGSYQKSCRNCEMQNCSWLVCRCDHNDTGIDTSKCPAGQFCNNNGNLQCGAC